MSDTHIIKTEIQGLEATELLKKFDDLDNKFNILLDRVKPNPETTLLTRCKVAKMLGVSLVTIHDWSKKGVLKSYKVGNQVRFKESEVLEALKQKETKQNN